MGEKDRPDLGDSVYTRMGGESAKLPAAPDDDDVEGHAATRANTRAAERAARPAAPDDDDVEGHKVRP